MTEATSTAASIVRPQGESDAGQPAVADCRTHHQQQPRKAASESTSLTSKSSFEDSESSTSSLAESVCSSLSASPAAPGGKVKEDLAGSGGDVSIQGNERGKKGGASTASLAAKSQQENVRAGTGTSATTRTTSVSPTSALSNHAAATVRPDHFRISPVAGRGGDESGSRKPASLQPGPQVIRPFPVKRVSPSGVVAVVAPKAVAAKPRPAQQPLVSPLQGQLPLQAKPRQPQQSWQKALADQGDANRRRQQQQQQREEEKKLRRQQQQEAQLQKHRQREAEAAEAARRKEHQQREKEEAERRQSAQCAFPQRPQQQHQQCLQAQANDMGSSEGRGPPLHGAQQAGGGDGGHGKGAPYHGGRDRGGGGRGDQRQQMQHGRTRSTGTNSEEGGSFGNGGNGGGGRRGDSIGENGGASGTSGAPPTPLFERLVSEEVQELKAYARIIESQNRRLAELERIHEDLENRLEMQTKDRMQLEATLEEKERGWEAKCGALERELEQWKGFVHAERTKNERLLDQVNRKDQDIHRMLQRKYDAGPKHPHKHDQHGHHIHHSKRGQSERNMRGGHTPALAHLDSSKSSSTVGGGGEKRPAVQSKSPHEILASGGSVEAVRERNVTNSLLDFFGM